MNKKLILISVTTFMMVLTACVSPVQSGAKSSPTPQPAAPSSVNGTVTLENNATLEDAIKLNSTPPGKLLCYVISDCSHVCGYFLYNDPINLATPTISPACLATADASTASQVISEDPDCTTATMGWIAGGSVGRKPSCPQATPAVP